jgi:phospholipid transport system substrate-binding protein
MTQSCKQSTTTLLLLIFGAPVFALAGEPTEQIRQTTEKILAIVQKADLKGPDKEAERQRQMRKMIDERFDWAAMARSALGKNWRDMSEAHRTEFTGLFSELIEKTYMSKVESYSGEKILYKSDKVEGLYGVVEVAIVTVKGADIPVSYRVLKKGAEWLVYDVSIEGVSLVNNYRSQIGAILNSSSYDNLIVKIKAKIAASPSVQPCEKVPAAPAQKTGEGVL